MGPVAKICPTWAFGLRRIGLRSVGLRGVGLRSVGLRGVGLRAVGIVGLVALVGFAISGCGPGTDAGSPDSNGSAGFGADLEGGQRSMRGDARDVASTSPSAAEPADLASTSPSSAETADLASTSPSSAEPADLASTPPPFTQSFDLAIWNARIVDGSGAPARDGGVLVRDGVLVFVGRLDPDTLDVTDRFDAEGRVIAPGFIDAHAHGDPLVSPRFPNFLAQGVTTILLGQDGTSPRAAELAGLIAEIEAAPPWVNVGYLAGHGTLRGEAGLGWRPADAEGRARLARLVERAMEAGAFGLSLGLEYDAGRPADAEELAAAAAPVAARGGIVMSHMRNEDADQVERSLEELIEQGRRSGARVHVSHIKVVLGSDPGQPERILRLMDAARGEGIAVSADIYPYTASYTGLAILFPDWARGAADYSAIAASRREELAAHLRQRVVARNGPEATLFGTGPWAGRTLAEAARATGRPFEDILIELGPGGARAAYFVMDDAWMATFLLDPSTVIATDGSPGMEHPRGYGSFARVIRRFVVEDGLLSLEEAVAKMSGRTAALLGLDDPTGQVVARGLLREGFAADLVLFDPASVEDMADFESPHRLARGMDRVWVNGELVWDGGPVDGGPGTHGPGRVLRN